MIKGKTIPVSITDEMIQKREKYWRKKLPIDFIKFIKEYNGLIPQNQIVLCENVVLERFLCIVDSISESEFALYDIDVILTKYNEYMVFSEDTLGADLIPFAMLNKDKFLCLCYEKENPTVVVWSMDGSKEFNPNWALFTESFKDFLEKIAE